MVEEEGPKEEGEVPSLPPYTHDDQQDLPHTYIVKGKRTKRQRPQSPIPFTITTHMTQHSSSRDGGGDVSNGDHHVINNKTSNIIINHNSSSSSDDHDDAPCPNYNTTTEDEYTARCLILLAQGSQNVEPTRKYDQDNYSVPEKFNSKRYIEAPISGNGKAGMYVYECKTCGRTFPSFQALGGHRASHKKPKNIAAAEEKKMFINDYLSDEDEEEMTLFKKQKTSTIRNSNNYSSLSLEFNMGNMGIHKSASFPRIHECSHCGAEFTSGQALGGHMRRHRGAAPVANTTLSLGHSNQEEAADLQDSDQKNGLSLDLNLPAPEDDHHHHHNKESRFGLPPKQQKNEEKQAALVLSTATKLVDCRY